MQLLDRHVTGWTEEKTPLPIKKTELTAVEHFAKLKEEQDGVSILSKKIYKIADKELLVRNWCDIYVFLLINSLHQQTILLAFWYGFF